MARVWILTSETPRADKGFGVWLRDLGFQIMEAGVEITISRLEGQKVREVLAEKGLEVMQVFDPYREAPQQAPTHQRRQGAAAGFKPGEVGADLNS